MAESVVHGQHNHDTHSMTHDSVKVFNSRQPIYSLDWSGHSSHFCSLAVGSFVTESPGAESFSDGGCNSVQFPSLTDPHATEFSLATPTISLQFPSTKTMFSPNRVQTTLHREPIVIVSCAVAVVVAVVVYLFLPPMRTIHVQLDSRESRETCSVSRETDCASIASLRAPTKRSC